MEYDVLANGSIAYIDRGRVRLKIIGGDRSGIQARISRFCEVDVNDNEDFIPGKRKSRTDCSRLKPTMQVVIFLSQRGKKQFIVKGFALKGDLQKKRQALRASRRQQKRDLKRHGGEIRPPTNLMRIYGNNS